MLHETVSSFKHLVHCSGGPGVVNTRFQVLRTRSLPTLQQQNCSSTWSDMEGNRQTSPRARGAKPKNNPGQSNGYQRTDFLRPRLQQPTPSLSPSNFYQLHYQFQGQASSSLLQYNRYPTGNQIAYQGSCSFPNVVISRNYRYQSPVKKEMPGNRDVDTFSSAGEMAQWPEAEELPRVVKRICECK